MSDKYKSLWVSPLTHKKAKILAEFRNEDIKDLIKSLLDDAIEETQMAISILKLCGVKNPETIE